LEWFVDGLRLLLQEDYYMFYYPKRSIVLLYQGVAHHCHCHCHCHEPTHKRHRYARKEKKEKEKGR
jgi:hypothetical protein